MLALEYQRADDERLALAIKQYAIYLSKTEILNLYKIWRKAERLLLTIVAIDRLSLSGLPNNRIEKYQPFYSAHFHMVEELHIKHRDSFLELFRLIDQLSLHEHVQNALMPHAQEIISSEVREPMNNWVKSRIEGLQNGEGHSGSDLSVRTNERFLITLMRARHHLLEPVIKTFRRETKHCKSLGMSSPARKRGRPLDKGTRQLLQVALSVGMNTRTLAERLVQEGLDRNAKGKRSRARRIRAEEERLNTRLRAAQKAMEPGFPSRQNH